MGRWIASKRVSTAASGTEYFFLKNNSTDFDMKIQMRRVTATTSSDLTVYRNPTQDTAGTAEPLKAVDNQNDANSFAFEVGGAYSSLGESLTETIVPAGSSKGSQLDPGADEDNEVLTVPPGETVLVEVVDTSGTSGRAAFRATLVEELA